MSAIKPSKMNFVQKNLFKFNKPKTFRNKKTDYQRKEKHSGKLDAADLRLFDYCF